MARASVLQVTKNGDYYNFSFTRTGKPFIGAAQRVWQVKVNQEAIEIFSEKISDAVDAANKNPHLNGVNREPFVEAGRGLFKSLFPDKDPHIKELLGDLRKLKTPLLISTDDPALFWELLFDDSKSDFFGLNYRLGRRLRTRALPSISPRTQEEWRWLIITNPNPNRPDWALPETDKEVGKLREWLAERQGVKVDYLQGENASFKSVLEHLTKQPYDVIHYAGHTIYDKKEKEYAICLYNGRLLGASLIKQHVQGSPIVFINGCWTGVAKGLSNSPGIVEGLTDAFLEAGAKLVVGSLFEAPDEGARAFAETFYEAVMKGKLVGEAMRSARLHTMSKAEYGPAWACFVMYGDPCLRMNMQEDTLQRLLQSVKLIRKDFDSSCLRVIEQAMEYGAQQGLVATPHLFAAMVDGESPRVRDCLREQGTSPETLRNAFAEAFKASGTSKKRSRLQLSDNVQEILKEAQNVACAKGEPRISEFNLIEGFVRKHGGNTGEILRHSLGIDLGRLVEGPGMKMADFTPEAWAILVRAFDLADAASATLIGTPHLFISMLQDPKSGLSKTLRRFGIGVPKSELGKQEKKPAPVPSATISLPLSKSISDIIAIAQDTVRGERRTHISIRDLLVGFVRQGGGSVGDDLRKKGIQPQMLLSELLLDSGALNPTVVSSEVQQFFRSAQKLVEQKGQNVIGRRHLLYGMLASEHSLLANLLREKRKDPNLIAELLDARLPGQLPGKTTVAAPIPLMSSALATFLCSIEFDGPEQKHVVIDERRLLAPFLEHLSTDIKEFLIREGVQWRDLIETARL